MSSHNMELSLRYFEPVIRKIVYYLSTNDYSKIEANKHNGRVNIKDLERAITEYGCTIIPLPDEAFTKAEIYNVENGNRLDVYIPLWTKEEGRSDLTLSLSCYVTNETVKVDINDLRVL